MKKVLNKLKDKELDVLFLILILVSSTSMFSLVECNDELWNFANSYKMFNNYKIYEELNVIVTPLFFYIAQIFFKIFGATLLSFRIYNVFIYSTLLVLIYLIFKSLKIFRRRAIFYTFIIAIILREMIAGGANYNIFAIIPILTTIFLIINKKENCFFLGILLFLTFMLKQNVFAYFAIGIFIYKILSGKNTKKSLGDLLKIYIISFIGILIFFIYLYLDNNLYNFINYCFFGIGEFGAKNLGIEISALGFLGLSIMVAIFTIIIISNKKIKMKIENSVIINAKCLLSFGIPLLLISFPIANKYHAILSSIILLIEFFYIIDNILIKNLQININKEKSIYVIMMIIFYTISLTRTMFAGLIGIQNGEIILNNNGALYGTIMLKENYEDIKIICDYIKQQEINGLDVKILSYEANLYMIHLNKNNGIFDLGFLGNLGSEGESGLINQIKELDKTLVLIKSNEEEMEWQESKTARRYIINNYNKVGEIQKYSIYYTNGEL